jgi:hypothetical protein
MNNEEGECEKRLVYQKPSLSLTKSGSVSLQAAVVKLL